MRPRIHKHNAYKFLHEKNRYLPLVPCIHLPVDDKSRRYLHATMDAQAVAACLQREGCTTNSFAEQLLVLISRKTWRSSRVTGRRLFVIFIVISPLTVQSGSDLHADAFHRSLRPTHPQYRLQLPLQGDASRSLFSAARYAPVHHFSIRYR